MTIPALIAIFIISFFVISFTSMLLMKKLQKIAQWLNFSEALLGIVAALGANSPEISSSIFAIFRQHHEIGFGIIIGSNIINLAGLLGISAVISGQIKLRLPILILNGGVAVVTIIIMTFLLLGQLTIIWACLFLIVLFCPYFYLISKQPSQIKKMSLPPKIKNELALMVHHPYEKVRQGIKSKIIFLDFLIVTVSLLIIIAGSCSLVFSAVELANYWKISHTIVAVLILAGLTSVPNIIMAIIFAQKGLGAAVVSETFNSNSLNFITGICLPVLIFGMGKVSKQIEFSFFYLLGMTLITIGGLSLRKGLRRLDGIIIIMLYIIYALMIFFR